MLINNIHYDLKKRNNITLNLFNRRVNFQEIPFYLEIAISKDTLFPFLKEKLLSTVGT